MIERFEIEELINNLEMFKIKQEYCTILEDNINFVNEFKELYNKLQDFIFNDWMVDDCNENSIFKNSKVKFKYKNRIRKGVVIGATAYKSGYNDDTGFKTQIRIHIKLKDEIVKNVDPKICELA